MKDWRHATVDRVARGVLWFFRFLKGWLPRMLGGAASLVFVIWGALGGAAWKSGLWLLIVGGSLALMAFFAEFAVQRPSYMKLSQLREEAERRASKKADALENAVRIMLVRLARVCKLDGHSDRMSVYYFHDDRFFMVARYARNPTYDVRRRKSYPAGEGAIGTAWNAEQGQALVKMSAGKDAWDRAARRQGMSDETIAGLTMRSLGLGGYRLEVGERSVGVLIIESTTPNRIRQEHLDEIAESPIVTAIAELVAAFALMTPAGESFTSAQPERAPRKWQSVVRGATPR